MLCFFIPLLLLSNALSIRIVQYNAEWLFLNYYSSMDCFGNGCSWHTLDEATNHLNNVAKYIGQLNPDIINLCEVESEYELNALILALNDTSYVPYFIKGTDTATGQNTAMISRIIPTSLYRTNERANYPINGTHCFDDGSNVVYGDTGVSKHYIAEFEAFVLIGIHLIAIPTDPDRCAQREAQAQVIQNVVKQYLTDGKQVIVIGDINDYDADIKDINGNIPISNVLKMLKYEDNLLNIFSGATDTENFYTNWWDSDGDCSTASIHDYSMIDHILVTPTIYDSITSAFIYHAYDEYCGKIDSDHYPVVVDLTL